jgi:hypothetical protein
MANDARFEPRFTLVLVYFFAAVVVWGIILAAPDMMDAWRELPPDADPAHAGSEVVRQALQGRMFTAALAAVISLGALIWLGVLPGLRRRDSKGAPTLPPSR